MNNVQGGDQTVGEAKEEDVYRGRRRRGSYQEGDGMEKSSDKLLQVARKEGHWEVVEEEDGADR